MKKHTLFIVIIIGIALAIGIWRENIQNVYTAQSVKQFSPTLPLSVGTILSQPQKLPDFELTDMNGEAFNINTLKQHWSFVFFGYSSCPNICPAILDNLHQISQRLHAGPNVQFVMISIDPKHDTPQRLKTYLQQEKLRDLSLVGVTGNEKRILELAKTIGIHIGKEKDLQTNHIEHGGTLLLINPEGQLMAVFTSTEKPAAIVHDFKEIVHYYVNAV